MIKRAIIFSDIHLHNWRQFSKVKNGYNSRMLIGVEVLEQIRLYAIKNDIETIFFCGDLFHNGSALSPDLLECLFSELREWRSLNAYFLPGQHDYHALDGGINAVEPLRDYVEVLSGFGASEFMVRDTRVVAIPHRKNLNQQKLLMNNIQPGPGIFLGHFLLQEIMEADNVTYPVECMSFSDLVQDMDYYLLGDYHSHVWIPDKRLMSVGVTHQHSFNECGYQGSFIDFDFENGTFERIPVRAPEFCKVEMGKGATWTKGNFYRISVKSEKEAELAEKSMQSICLDLEYQVVFDGSEESKGNGDEPVRIDDMHFTMNPSDIVKKYMEHLGVLENKELFEMGMNYIGGK